MVCRNFISGRHLCRTRLAGKLAHGLKGDVDAEYVSFAWRLAWLLGLRGLRCQGRHWPPHRPQPFPRSSARRVIRLSSRAAAALYAIQCRSCHGVDLRGGDLGGPNLLRSQLVLSDQAGEAIAPVVMNGRNPPGGKAMPALPLPRADIDAIAEYIHSVVATAQPQGAPPPGAQVELNLLVGNAKSGETLFRRAMRELPFRHRRPGGHCHARARHRPVAGQLGIGPARRRARTRCRRVQRR